MKGIRNVTIVCTLNLCLSSQYASADAVALVAEDATDGYAQFLGLAVCKVYVEFGDSSDNLLLLAYADITTNDPAGFFQHPAGDNNTAPNSDLFIWFPALPYDSFVTIKLPYVPAGGSNTTALLPGWDPFEFNNNGHVVGGWYNSVPLNGQGTPDANLQVLVAQFTVDEGYYVYGDLTAFYNTGWTQLDSCFRCYFCDTCEGDLDCDGQVGASDLSILISAWGPNPCHPADFNDDGMVDAADQAILLSNNGLCPCIPGDTGFLSPSAEAFDTGGDGDGFELKPTDAFADDGAFASNVNGNGDRHRYYNYGFSILPACNVSGIEVRLDWWLDAVNGNNSLEVELSWDGGTSWTAAKIDAQETTTEHTVILGGSVDNWGRTWSLADFDNANFRVRVSSEGHSQRDWFLDWVPVKVTYSPNVIGE